MKVYFRLLCISRKKKLARKGNRRWFKRVALERKSICCPNLTPIYIPLDLQVNTLLRLPVKSLLRFRCVSKLWSSIITSLGVQNQDMNIAASSSPRRLLIAFRDFYGNRLIFVSLANPNALSSSSCRVPYRDLSLLKVQGKLVHNTVRGLICLGSRVNKGLGNPSTRQLHISPQLKFKGRPNFYPLPKFFFGYDSVEDQYKVLAIDYIHGRAEHKVLVVGGGKSWRDVSCVTCLHTASTSGLYMNGSIHYGALKYEPTDIGSPDSSIIVSFNVKLETFNIIKVPSKLVPIGYEFMWKFDLWDRTDKVLINYRDKIGVVENPREGSFRMWVVEDAEREEWSMNTYHLPQTVSGLDFKVMETFSTGEICLFPKELPDPFCLFYYNLKTNSMRSVTIEGLPISELKRAQQLSVTVSDHYESFMSLEHPHCT